MQDFDLVIFGATGFTGQLTAAYVAQHKGAARIAIAGRDRAKLEALRDQLGADVGIVVADVADRASLDALVERTKVVCTTVGPYAKYGDALVAACVAAGVDCCDLTGEAQWVKRVIDAHHEAALLSGARIVNSCGFDSIPSDLGTMMLQSHARATHGAPCAKVTFAMRRMKGGASGGTVASMFEMFEAAGRDAGARKALGDPYSLVPKDARGPDRSDVSGVAWDDDLQAWTAPFIMASHNAKIVRRSNALMGFPYGRDFSYREVSAFKRGARGLARAASMTMGLAGLAVAGTAAPLRSLLKVRLPKPGEGPSKELRERGFFDVELMGKGTSKDGAPFTVRGRVAAKGDPGYAATARMLGEAALCLAMDGENSGGGVLTPAAAMGEPLLQRLRAAGMTFEITAG